ncbi:hypothetical protein M3210_06125 [Oceanobacillus luteolus]|uniref:Uncharacterized protein n=1 Tax=Oceanobacillus luteolus TaxID=1274358 RepID=A0ABW4HT34_9BACI|nr:hypothetical protein [Oceanobacillus luteolus]MCM3739844.1 hypothetical protein [Oceanobacillus luteolus]
MMEALLTTLRLTYVVIFFIAIFYALKFEFGRESKDERGKSIMNRSYGIIFPLLPLGWFLIEMYDQYIQHLNYETYKLVIWFLISGLMILHATILTVLRRIY